MKLENNKTEAISNLKHIKSDNLTDWYKAATNNIETYFKYKNICHDNRRLLINRKILKVKPTQDKNVPSISKYLKKTTSDKDHNNSTLSQRWNDIETTNTIPIEPKAK